MSPQYLCKEQFFFWKLATHFELSVSSTPQVFLDYVIRQWSPTHCMAMCLQALSLSAFESPPSERHCQTSRLDLHKQLPVRLEKYLSFASQQHYSKTFTYINSHLHFPKKMHFTYAAIFHFLFSILPFQNFWLPSKGKIKKQKQHIQHHLYRCATQDKLLEKLKSKHILKQWGG